MKLRYQKVNTLSFHERSNGNGDMKTATIISVKLEGNICVYKYKPRLKLILHYRS